MSESAAFALFYEKHLSVVEGGISDHKDDTGGKTWYGISSGFLRSLGRSGPINRAQARAITYEFFWAAHGLDDMDDLVAWCYCDALFHHRPRTAKRLLQRSLGVTPDGSVGPITRAAARRVRRLRFFQTYRLERTRLYSSIVQNNASQSVFMTGWMQRLAHLGDELLLCGQFDRELKLHWSNGAM